MEFLNVLNKMERATPNLQNPRYYFYTSTDPSRKFMMVGWMLYNVVAELSKHDDATITVGSMETGQDVETIHINKDPFQVLRYL